MTKPARHVTLQPPVSENASDAAAHEGPKDETDPIQILNTLATDLKSNRSLDLKLRQTAQTARALTHADIAFFCAVDRSIDGYYASAVFGDAPLEKLLQGLPVPAPPTERPAGAGDCTVISFGEHPSGRSLFVDQIRHAGVVIGMVTPLQVEDRHLGFLFAGNRNPVEFTKTEQCLLSFIGNLVTSEIDRKQSEAKHNRLETVLEQAAESIMITNRDGVIQYVNPYFEAVSGYSRQEVIGKRPNLLHSGRQSAAFYRDMKNTLQHGNVWRGHLVNRRKDGTLYELEGIISPIKNDRGEITDYVSVRKDVTQENLLKRQLYQAQKMEAIGTLAGGIAHDFNNLLMGVQGNISLMRMDMPQHHTVQKRCETVEKYIQKGADLTRQLLGIGRGGKYQQIPTDLSKLTNATLDMFGRTKKEIQTHMASDPRPCIAEVDPGQIDQVLLNLFVNAWQAMPRGGHLYVRTQLVSDPDMHPGIPALKPEGYVKITIRDTGAGIDKMILDKIFDPFFTTKGKSRGTGLGLASAYGIIKNHGGIIQARSKKGQGATFDIWLPASGKRSMERKSPVNQIAAGRGTILIVDDEAMVLEICGEMLNRLGYRVITASTGSDAVSLFKERQNEIDLVILDLVMPGMRGEEVYDRLVAEKPDIRVLLASGYARENGSRTLIPRDTVDFIQKPYTVTGLSQKVRQMVLNDGNPT